MQNQVFEYPNATVRVHFPDIAEIDNKIQLEEIKRSAERVLQKLYYGDEEEEQMKGIQQYESKRTDPQIFS